MTCSICSLPATHKQGNQKLCAMHYRFGQMRALAKRRGKEVPSRKFLAELVETTKLNCVGCGIKMNWMANDGQKTVVTLQHDRSGRMTFLCRGCNTRHMTFSGDDFYSISKSHHPCRDCGKVLPKTDFHPDRSRPLGIKSYCKNCSYERYKLWSCSNRERINASQRKRRVAN